MKTAEKMLKRWVLFGRKETMDGMMKGIGKLKDITIEVGTLALGFRELREGFN
jgi:hypothetical protein